jgi:hypothetical protein
MSGLGHDRRATGDQGAGGNAVVGNPMAGELLYLALCCLVGAWAIRLLWPLKD